ncbi:MAG: helix-turn-helix transcriptional regulator [Candidatus Izemoplasmatales bacterium]|jgi:transcriptional regulator with XRE-family HTH domain
MIRTYLKTRRKELGLSIEELAFRVDVSYNYVLNIENGHQGDKASFLMMSKLAKGYEYSLDEIYHLELKHQNKEEVTYD